MRSKTRSPANGKKGRVPSRWQRELATQANLRRKINHAQRELERLRAAHDRAMREGGKGWINKVGSLSLAIDRTWDRERRLLLQLYSRKEVV